jgi:hypothetical protein
MGNRKGKSTGREIRLAIVRRDAVQANSQGALSPPAFRGTRTWAGNWDWLDCNDPLIDC